MLRTWKIFAHAPGLAGSQLHAIGRSLLLAAAVGLIAGIGALLFHWMTQAATFWALEVVAGYDQGGPANEADMFEHAERRLRPWLLVVVPTIGGLLSGWLVFRFAPEAEGHGTDSAIDAYHRKRGIIRPVVPIVKMIASAITLGTGGSGGREGPIAQIGAGFGSYLGTKLGLSDAERRLLLAAGLGAGIGAIFHAPLAGAIFAIEVLYREADFEAEALIPAFIATTVAYCVFNFTLAILGQSEGFVHLFDVAPGIRFRDPVLLVPLTVLVLVMVGASWLYVKALYSTEWTFRRMSVRKWLKPAIGAGLTGLFALVLYYGMAITGSDAAQHDVLSVLSFGYGYLQEILLNPDGEGLMIPVLLAVAFGKIITTSLTIGSGGSGGVFGPSMIIGGALGAVVGKVFEGFIPGVVRVDVFIVLGMAGFFAAAAKTPVSTLIMVTEMTASYELLLPAMWVCALAYVLSRGWSLFHAQVPTRVDSPAHRGDFIIDVMQGLTVRDAMAAASREFITIPPEMPLREVARLITGTKQACFPVVDDTGRFHGLFDINDVRQFLYDSEVGELAVALDLAHPGDWSLKLDESLGEAIRDFAATRFDELPVIDPDAAAGTAGSIVGMLRRRDVIAAYNQRLMEYKVESTKASI